jgi:hypothetical protein
MAKSLTPALSDGYYQWSEQHDTRSCGNLRQCVGRVVPWHLPGQLLSRYTLICNPANITNRSLHGLHFSLLHHCADESLRDPELAIPSQSPTWKQHHDGQKKQRSVLSPLVLTRAHHNPRPNNISDHPSTTSYRIARARLAMAFALRCCHDSVLLP